jgi:hypothetical protein
LTQSVCVRIAAIVSECRPVAGIAAAGTCRRRPPRKPVPRRSEVSPRLCGGAEPRAALVTAVASQRPAALALHAGYIAAMTASDPGAHSCAGFASSGRDPLEADRSTTPLEPLYDLTIVVGSAPPPTSSPTTWPTTTRAGAIGVAFAPVAVTWAWINLSWFASAYKGPDYVPALVTFRTVNWTLDAESRPERSRSMAGQRLQDPAH